MPDSRKIINCHIHVFTRANVPPGFPPFPLNLLSRTSIFRKPLVWLLRSVWPFSSRDLPHRYANLIEIASLRSQEAILEQVRSRYPLNTQFIVLPMDLRGLQRGQPKQDVRAQHLELLQLARKFPDIVIPFIHVDPRSLSEFGGPDPVEWIAELHQEGFRGIKLYPPLGYGAADESVMPIYEFASEHRLPVMTHCSRGGVRAKSFKDKDVERVTAPHLYRAVLERFPDLKLCLAHFGGGEDWEAYLKQPWDDDSKPLEEMNWLSQISTMIRGGDFPNLYTDVSYTIFRLQRYVPVLKVFLADEKIRKRTLFGSDYFLAEQQSLPERELAMRLRAGIGEDLFWQIAFDNPRSYLA